MTKVYSWTRSDPGLERRKYESVWGGCQSSLVWFRVSSARMRQVRRRVLLAPPVTEDVSSHRTAFANSMDKRHTTSVLQEGD